MGKPKLSSSIRAIFNLRPLSSRKMTWVCAQQARTDSFREVSKSFNSMYFSPSSIAFSSLNHEDQASPPHRGKRKEEEEEEESLSSPSSSSPAPPESSDSNSDESISREVISSQRFFFTPCTTKSIMKPSGDESPQKLQLGGDEISSSTDRYVETAEMSFCKESVMLAMASHDPYMDFRVSMEEMVEAHELREWSCLQELLHCYLRLNEKKTHKIIILAFVDLLMSLASEEQLGEEEAGHVRSCFPSCICLNEKWNSETKRVTGINQN